MGRETTISWTDATWNPIRGCTRVSEGCRNCYAEMVARRFSGPGLAYEGLVRIDSDGQPHEWNGNIKFVERHLLDPLKWKEPKRIFVNSMSDLFHENVKDEWLDEIFRVMARCPQHTFQILTKRPERMRAVLTDRWKTPYPFPNIHLGVSCENQAAADERIPLLLETPAAVRFISAEPLLGPIRLDECAPYTINGDESNPGVMNAFNAWCYHPLTVMNAPEKAGNNNGISWVIVGGESGTDHRPMQQEWAESLQAQCKAAGVAFFMKQMAGRTPSIGASLIPEHLMIRQFPVTA